MKKVITVVGAILLILIIGGVTIIPQIIERYSYSKERVDFTEYYGLEKAEDVAILLEDELLSEKAILSEGHCYFDLQTVQTYLNHRFYVDKQEGLLLYTTATKLIRNTLGSTTYTVNGESVDAGYVVAFARVAGNETTYYIAADFVQQYTDMYHTFFQEPNRMVITTSLPEQQTAGTVKKNSNIRVLGGVKSPILTPVAEGDRVVILNQMDTWSEVKTADGFRGYIENKDLTDVREEVLDVLGFPEQEEYTSLTRDHKIALGWHAIFSTAGNATLGEVASAARGMNVIAPTWFSLSDNQGNFESFAQSSYVNSAHEIGLEVWGVVDNFNYKYNNNADVDTATVLGSTTARTNLIQGLVGVALELGLDGINVDFEQIQASYGEDYVQFLREISVACRNAGLVLSVDNPVIYSYNQHYDIAEQGVIADYVIIMGYDEHGGDSGQAGSVASLSFVTDGIRIATEQVPSNKVINALPFYTRLWCTEGSSITSRAIGLSAVAGLLSEYNMTVVWDEETGQNYASATRGDAFYQMWVEDTQSILAKVNVMSAYDLGGVAVWRLGYETAGIWDILTAYTLQ